MVDGEHYDRGLRRFLSGVSRRPCSCVDPYVGRGRDFWSDNRKFGFIVVKVTRQSEPANHRIG